MPIIRENQQLYRPAEVPSFPLFLTFLPVSCHQLKKNSHKRKIVSESLTIYSINSVVNQRMKKGRKQEEKSVPTCLNLNHLKLQGFFYNLALWQEAVSLKKRRNAIWTEAHTLLNLLPSLQFSPHNSRYWEGSPPYLQLETPLTLVCWMERVKRWRELQ